MTDDDYLPPSTTQVTLSRSASGGLAALVIGCTLLISACVLMAFNIILWGHGFRGIPIGLAQVGGVIGIGSITVLGVVAVAVGANAWGAARSGESSLLGVAGTTAGAGGLVAWLIAGINLLLILFS
jgi:hypothetical protein